MEAHHCGMNIMYACAPPLYGNHEEGRRRREEAAARWPQYFPSSSPLFFLSSFASFTRSPKQSSYMFSSLSFFLLYLAGRAPAGQSPPSSPSRGGSVLLRRAGAALYVRSYVGHWHSSSPFLIYREEEENIYIKKSVVSDLVSPLSQRKDRSCCVMLFFPAWLTNK